VRPNEWKAVRRYATGVRADSELDTEDIDFDIYKKARELMESSGMIMLPQQEVQAGGVHLWQLRRQATSASNGYAISEFQCLMCHLCKCNVGLRIVGGPGFMQLERLGMHDRQSHVTPPRRALMQSIEDENGSPEPDVRTTIKKPRRMRILRMSTLRMMMRRMMTMMMSMTMIPEMTELKFRLMKRNIPARVCNRLSGLVSRAEN
jgi:hypothetical protein